MVAMKQADNATGPQGRRLSSQVAQWSLASDSESEGSDEEHMEEDMDGDLEGCMQEVGGPCQTTARTIPIQKGRAFPQVTRFPHPCAFFPRGLCVLGSRCQYSHTTAQ